MLVCSYARMLVCSYARMLVYIVYRGRYFSDLAISNICPKTRMCEYVIKMWLGSLNLVVKKYRVLSEMEAEDAKSKIEAYF
jgi:hypothetical protein